MKDLIGQIQIQVNESTQRLSTDYSIFLTQTLGLMKVVSLFSALVFIISFSSCEKLNWDKDGYECGFDKDGYDKDGHECGCDKDDDKDDKADYKKYVIEDLVKTDKCECIVKGKIKYVKNGKTTAIVDYGDGECDNIATKTVCVDGDCDHEKSETFEFEFDCDEDSKD